MEYTKGAKWQLGEVKSPQIDNTVTVIAAKNVPYVLNGNRFQNISIYLPKTADTSHLINTSVLALPRPSPVDRMPRWHVHIHGGAWRDPFLTSASIEPAVAHAFSDPSNSPITAIASINYTLSPFPTHPTLPYDPSKGDRSDPAREGYHPDFVRDVLSAFVLLRDIGLKDDSYVLSGHSAGSCLAFQSTLQSPHYWGFDSLPDPPRPAAVLGLNGLYDLQGLVHDLGTSHANLEEVYLTFLSISFGGDQDNWEKASPAKFELEALNERMKRGNLPRLVVLDQSQEDQLVPMNQTEKLETNLAKVNGLRLIRGNRCKGQHAAPWLEGWMIWENIQDILKHLAQQSSFLEQ